MALLAALLTASWAGGDDTKLLRVAASKPYVYIVLDTSSSMNLSSSLRASTQDPPVWVVAGADDPGSMFHEVRSVLAEVLDTAYRSHGEFAQFGFVGFDQNHLRVRGKHWRYAALEDGIDVGGTPDPAAGEELTCGARLPTTADPGGITLLEEG